MTFNHHLKSIGNQLNSVGICCDHGEKYVLETRCTVTNKDSVVGVQELKDCGRTGVSMRFERLKIEHVPLEAVAETDPVSSCNSAIQACAWKVR